MTGRDDDAVAVPIDGTLDLHAFRPRDVGSLVPDWLEACRAAGLLEVRVVHGKGTGALRAGVLTLLERSGLVRATRQDENWGGVVVLLHDPATDEARVRAILAGSPRLLAALAALERAGPPGAWLGAGAVRNRLWHALHRRPGEPEESDLDVAWHAAGDPAADAAWTARLTGELPGPWEVVDQARYGASSAEDGISRWPETATCVGVRPGLELLAAWSWADVLGMVVRPTPSTSEATWKGRLATKRWRQRFPWVRIEPFSAV